MCGRFTLSESWDEVLETFGIGVAASDATQPARYNIAPGQSVAAVISDGEQRRIGLLRWGLVPQWAKDDKSGWKMINARAETVRERPAFKTLLQRKRCVIPADGFFEWKKTDGKRQPMRIVLTDRKLFGFAGLYDTWTAADGTRLSTCTIVTTEPNELMAAIHTRMPAILSSEAESVWLNRRVQDPDLLQTFLTPYSAAQMRAYPVAPSVGNVRNDGPECIEEWDAG